MITNIPCVILSGGKSSRMGEDKSLLPFGEFDTMIEYQYNKLSQIFQDVYISSKDNKFNFQANLILDQDKNESSPIIALDTIFQKIETKKIFIVTVDVPLLHTSTIKDLVQKSQKSDIIIARDEERVHNLCGVFDSSLLPTIKDMLSNGIHKVNYLIRSTKNHKIITYENMEQFMNLNDQNTYKQAKLIS
jgi:molybdopterin-guanine dinucleotide biosynthesis protein A